MCLPFIFTFQDMKIMTENWLEAMSKIKIFSYNVSFRELQKRKKQSNNSRKRRDFLIFVRNTVNTLLKP